MNESLQYHTAVNRHADFDHSVLARAYRAALEAGSLVLHAAGNIPRCAAGGLVVAATGSQCHGIALVSPRPMHCAGRPASISAGQCLMVRHEPFTSRSSSTNEVEAAAVGD